MGNVIYAEQTIFDALANLRKPEPPQLNTWTDDFKKRYETVFAATPDDAWVGVRSMVSGLGLALGSQLQKN